MFVPHVSGSPEHQGVLVEVLGLPGSVGVNEGVGFLRGADQEDLKSTLVPPYSEIINT